MGGTRRHPAALVPVLVALGCGGAEVRATRGQPLPSREATPVPVRPPEAQPSPAPAGIRVGPSEASRRCAEVWPLIEKAAREAQVEPALLVGLVRAESNFRNDVRSAAGAVGLTQVIPATARAKKCGDLSDPYQNLLCGARVLAGFLAYYNGDVILGLSGYNAGHGMPEAARDAQGLPRNIEYVETVLWARARFLFRGCDF